MRLNLPRQQLLDALLKLLPIISDKAVIPIRSCFKFEIGKTQLLITATNESTQVSLSTDINNVDEFSFCCNAKLISETIRLFTSNDVEIILMENKIQLKNGRAKYHIATEPADIYPMFTFTNSDQSIRIPSDAFLTGIGKCSWLVDDQNKVPVMAGISVKNELGKLNIVGCQHVAILNYDHPLLEQSNLPDCVIPKASAVAMKNVLDGKELTLMISDKKMRVSTYNCEIISILIDYKYPETRRFFTQKPTTFIRTKRAEFLQALNRLKLYAPKEENSVVDFDIQNGMIKMTASDLFQNNFGEEEIAAPESTILNQSKYNLFMLYNGAMQFSGEEVDLFFGLPNQPLFISSIDAGDTSETQFILRPLI
jgi:DNA polymerase-3 subunit beta